MTTLFVADVGGTHIRLAQTEHGKLINIRKYLSSEFANIAAAIQHYFAEFANIQFSAGCIAIACPVSADWVKMTNHHWQFSITELQQNLQLQWLGVINDFTAVAHSLSLLNHQQKVQIGGGRAIEHGNIAVFGPGTGLGVEHLTWTAAGWKTLAGEGGHVDFAPVDENDLIVWRYLTARDGRASTEEVLSGRGLLHIYQALAAHQGEPAVFTEPAQISTYGLNHSCPICYQALQQFCRIMGSVAGNLALNLAATGGVYIGGGIASRLIDFIANSDFRVRFEAKGRMADFVVNMPTYIISEPNHGMLGAAAYMQQHL